MPDPTLQDTDLILDTETTGLGRYGEDDVLDFAIVDGCYLETIRTVARQPQRGQ